MDIPGLCTCLCASRHGRAHFVVRFSYPAFGGDLPALIRRDCEMFDSGCLVGESAASRLGRYPSGLHSADVGLRRSRYVRCRRNLGARRRGLVRVQDPIVIVGPSGRRSHHHPNWENTAGSRSARSRRRSRASSSMSSRALSDTTRKACGSPLGAFDEVVVVVSTPRWGRPPPWHEEIAWAWMTL